MARKKNSRQWARLRILCSAGLELMTVAQDAFLLVRELIPNTSSHLALRAEPGSKTGRPVPAAAPHAEQDAVLLNVVPPPQAYYFSDHADAPSAIHRGSPQSITAPLESGGLHYGDITLYRDQADPFEEADEEDLRRVANYFVHTLVNAGELEGGANGIVEDEAMLLATGDGQILYLSDAAGALLDQLAVQERQRFDRRTLPPFCMRLAESIVHGDRYPWLLPLGRLPMPGGVLEARAQWMSAAGAPRPVSPQAADQTVGVFMKFVVPLPLRIWRALGSVELSPQQAEVAFWMGVGGSREAARARVDVSEAVMRDCVKAVYEKFGCSSEAGLLEQLR
ncbi:hypothetical protein E4L96_09890 [Massilia arenosa]|uniref:Uncharacterized protein n=1 Tax=Zemynaea arenosa TaxID=2561931 RepID=A0A4Y9SJ13_9BURK|nr:hypothetical protein [Massilia arenosa]TFW20802.1 hypothetical protein E4L96_09890 [Massilia arenosa]